MNINLQYYHNREVDNERTYCVDIDFTRTDLLDLLQSDEDTLEIEMGVAHKHPDDQYDKSIGRECSEADLKTYKFTLDRVIKSGDKLIFFFTGAGVFLKIRTSHKSEKPHLIEVV